MYSDVCMQERCNLGSLADCLAAGHFTSASAQAPALIIGILAQVGGQKAHTRAVEPWLGDPYQYQVAMACPLPFWITAIVEGEEWLRLLVGCVFNYETLTHYELAA